MNHPFAGAAKIGKTLRPTEVLSFGNPQRGTPFMECAQAVGIDLAPKALVWEDAAFAAECDRVLEPLNYQQLADEHAIHQTARPSRLDRRTRRVRRILRAHHRERVAHRPAGRLSASMVVPRSRRWRYRPKGQAYRECYGA